MTISDIFEKERPTHIVCVKTDTTYHLTEGNKYKVESYNERNNKLFMLFINDVGWEMEMQVGESSKHFIPIISDRKRKLDRILKGKN
jgi:hypothetical protein